MSLPPQPLGLLRQRSAASAVFQVEADQIEKPGLKEGEVEAEEGERLQFSDFLVSF